MPDNMNSYFCPIKLISSINKCLLPINAYAVKLLKITLIGLTSNAIFSMIPKEIIISKSCLHLSPNESAEYR